MKSISKPFHFVADAFKDVFATFGLIFKLANSVKDIMVRTDEENLEKLLKTPEDQVKFQKALDEAIKDSSAKEVILNGRNVRISA